MIYGITKDGIKIMRLPDIIESIQQGFRNLFGDIDVSAGSVAGQFTGVLSDPIATLWEEIQNAYYSNNPKTAEGVSLDYCASFTPLYRLKSTPTQVDIALFGDPGTIVEPGKIFKSTSNAAQFQVTQSITLSPDNQKHIYIKMLEVLPGTVYPFTVECNGETYSVSVDSSVFIDPSFDDIINLMVYYFELNAVGVFTAENVGEGVLSLKSVSPLTFDLTAYDDALLTYANNTLCDCIVKGSIAAPIYSVVEIVNPVSGLDSVKNYFEGVKGRDIETDAAFRLRWEKSKNVKGSGNLEAIISYIKENVPGVVICKGAENDTDLPVGDLLPHSIKITVDGGTPEDIGAALWAKKSGGIQTMGSESVVVLDSNGDEQIMKFSRPVAKYAWIKASLTLYSEETFSADGLQQVKENLYNFGNDNFTLGLDLIPVRFIPPTLEVKGIGTVLIEVSLTDLPDDTPVYTEDILPIASDNYAAFDVNRVTVILL